MTVSLNGTTGVTFPDASVQNTAATGFGFKNRLINGAMVIDQRNAGASVNPSDGAYTLDRWSAGVSLTSKLTIQQSTTAPAGFSSSLLVTSSSAYSVTSSDYFGVVQRIEGFNTADFAFGTASASTVTLSFWVRSSLTGTFSGSLRNSARNRSYVFTYTINAANTWEQKTITIAGDTSGTWVGATNEIGLQVWFSVGAGSTYNGTANSWASANYIAVTGATSVVGTNGATFYITGVQLEKGSTATSFDYRPYGTELALCQRYFETGSFAFIGYTTSGSGYGQRQPFMQTKRAAPTMATSLVSSTNVTGLGLASNNIWNFGSNAYAVATGVTVYSGAYTASSEL